MFIKNLYQLLNKFIFCLFFLIVSFTSLCAQEESTLPIKVSYFDFTVNPSFPINTFGDKLNQNMIGFSLSLIKQKNASRLDFFGLQLNYAHMGALSEVFPTFEERTGTNLWNLQLLYRYFPNFFFWKIEPFVEAGLGPQLIYTLTTTQFFEDGSSDFSFEDSDWGISYGVGIGFTLHIADSILFVSKLSFQSGTAMTYFVRGDYNGGFPFDNFSPETSSINYIQSQFGISYIF